MRTQPEKLGQLAAKLHLLCGTARDYSMHSFTGSIVHSLQICEKIMKKVALKKRPPSIIGEHKAKKRPAPPLFVGQRVDGILLRRLERRI
jgi:hypothetical protein